MKRILKKNYLFLILALLLLVSSCQSDIDDNYELHSNASITEKSFEELLETSKFRNIFNMIPKKDHSISSSLTARTAMEDQYGFTIANVPVKVAVDADVTSYTMLITRDNQSATYFENLVIQEDVDNNRQAAIVKYTPTVMANEDLDHSFSFEGNIAMSKLALTNSNPTAGGADTCSITLIVCNQGGTQHIAGARCTRTYPITIRTTCANDDGGNNPSGGGPTGGTPTGGENNPGGSSDGNTSGNSPNNPLDANENEVVTAPVRPNLDDDTQGPKTPCSELGKLIRQNAFKHAIRDVEAETDNRVEKGWALRTFPNSSSLAPPQALTPDPKKPESVNIASYVGGDYIGACHSHPDPLLSNGVPMFSPEDISGLFSIAYAHNRAHGLANDFAIYTVTVSVKIGNKKTTMALKIKDWDTFFNAFNGPGNFKKIKDKMNRKYEDLGVLESLQTYQTEFLKFIKDSGISLYEAKEDLSGWDEVILDDNNEAIKNPIPCN